MPPLMAGFKAVTTSTFEAAKGLELKPLNLLSVSNRLHLIVEFEYKANSNIFTYALLVVSVDMKSNFISS